MQKRINIIFSLLMDSHLIESMCNADTHAYFLEAMIIWIA